MGFPRAWGSDTEGRDAPGLGSHPPSRSHSELVLLSPRESRGHRPLLSGLWQHRDAEAELQAELPWGQAGGLAVAVGRGQCVFKCAAAGGWQAGFVALSRAGAPWAGATERGQTAGADIRGTQGVVQFTSVTLRVMV